jgi:non-ribosomal peptide synthetase component F
MTGWNFADLWEICADVRSEAPAQVHGDLTIGWTEFDRRADGLASALLDAGLAHQDKVAQYFYNGPEYMQGVYACFKAGMVPVNTNYRYADDELVYLWDNADAAAVMFHGSFTPTSSASARVCPGSGCGCGPTTAHIGVPAGPRTSVGQPSPRRSTRSAARGDARGRTCGSSTPAVRPACPRV